MNGLVIEGVSLLDLEEWADVQCEEPHVSFPCSVDVRWVAPLSPCGCFPRHLACQAAYDHVIGSRSPFLDCGSGHVAPTAAWREGWLPV